jgi:CheY-like chemotaxis protein
MKTILFVDDNPIVVQAYRMALERAGYKVETAADGLAAMKVVVTLKPDAVLLDLMMPIVDGKYVLKFIRSQPELESTRVIILSDATIADRGLEVRDLNPDRLLLKSECTPKLLNDTLAELLGESGSQP